MTMPHLMNCDHSEEGWCLGCVKKLWEEKEAIEAIAESHLSPDKKPWQLFCDSCDRPESEPFDYGDKCPVCHGKLRHEYDGLLHTLDSYAGGGRFMVPAMQASRAIRWLRADLYNHLAKIASSLPPANRVGKK